MSNKQLKAKLAESERKLAIANNSVCLQMQEINGYIKLLEMKEKHMLICEREHHHKDRLITELKCWIGDLHRGINDENPKLLDM